MNASAFLAKTTKSLKSNSPKILTALGVSGLMTTSYLTAKATFNASPKLVSAPQDLPLKEKARLVWKFYIPAGISGALTITCIIGASKASGRRTTAAVTAYSLTERAFSEYREKVVKQIGKGKEQQLRDDIVQEKVSKIGGSKEIIIAGTGHILCCELFTNRYFRSDMETLRKAQNDINVRVVRDAYVSMDEFYYLISLSPTSNSGNLGWDSDRLLELLFSTVMSEGGEPCLAFDYNYTKPLK